jgi:nucleotide-binding universal stress UspA family protein
MVEPQWLVRTEEIMSLERILVPVDIAKWPVEVFSVANTFAKQPSATVILLHVVTLNIAAPEKRVYEQLGLDAQRHLERLARACLRPGITTVSRVRFGNPAEEILAEAADGKVDLIVLASEQPSFWRRLFVRILPRVVERIVRQASCGVFLTTAKKWFNCENICGRPWYDIGATSDRLDGALESEPSHAPRAEEAFAFAQEDHQAAARVGR